MDSNLPPLPWKIDAEGYPGAPVIKDASGAIVCAVYQRSGHPMTAHPTTDAAANLILAVPELLEACEATLPRFIELTNFYVAKQGPAYTQDFTEVIAQLKAAVARAKGEAT